MRRTSSVILDEVHHHHRRLKDILEIISAAPLSDAVKQTAERIFRRLAEAEGRVHGCSPEEVHFHEVGAVDAIVDIVGTAICLEMLGWPKVVASPMPTFHGYAKGAHGVFPLPAPATAEILRGVPWRKLDIEGELVTPTGAAIIREIAVEFGPLPAMTVERIGYGAGKSDFGIPNVLRVMIGEEPSGLASPQSVTVIETNIDDLNPQFYETAMERLFAAGALDVFLSPIQMKKNRPGTLLSVICDPLRAESHGGRHPGGNLDAGGQNLPLGSHLPGSPLGRGRYGIRHDPDQDRREGRQRRHGLSRVRGLQEGRDGTSRWPSGTSMIAPWPCTGPEDLGYRNDRNLSTHHS